MTQREPGCATVSGLCHRRGSLSSRNSYFLVSMSAPCSGGDITILDGKYSYALLCKEAFCLPGLKANLPFALAWDTTLSSKAVYSRNILEKRFRTKDSHCFIHNICRNVRDSQRIVYHQSHP
jgi:hypothetical protein